MKFLLALQRRLPFVLNKKELGLLLKRKFKKNAVKSGGFSLVELVVVIAIFSVIAGMLLTGYPSFRRKTSLKRTSQEIAMAIRQAQAYALGVKRFIDPYTPPVEFFPGYGVRFDINNPDSFVLFADLPIDVSVSNDGDKKYNEGGGCEPQVTPSATECVEKFEIQTNARVVDICADVKTNAPGVCGLNNLDVVYLRPNPFVSLRSNNGNDGPYSDVGIVVEAAGSVRRTIHIWTSGQISVE